MESKVVAVSVNARHAVSKINTAEIHLCEGLGVKGDAHIGKTVQHLSRIAKNPEAPNLRQVHLIHKELLEELKTKGFCIDPGTMGENITTCGVKLLELPTGTKLQLGEQAVIVLTGLRNPCKQLEGIEKGLMKAVLDYDTEGNLIRKAGVMATVLKSGIVKPGDKITVTFPNKPHTPLLPV